MDDKNKKICQRIREIRLAMKLSQGQFAELVNMSVDSIGKIERCVTAPKVATLSKMAEALKIPVADLLGTTTTKEKKQSKELSDLIAYLKTRSAQDVRLIHEIALKIFDRKR